MSKIDANSLVACQQHLMPAFEPTKESYWRKESSIYVDINQNSDADLIITIIGNAKADDQVILV